MRHHESAVIRRDVSTHLHRQVDQGKDVGAGADWQQTEDVGGKAGVQAQEDDDAQLDIKAQEQRRAALCAQPVADAAQAQGHPINRVCATTVPPV